MDKKRNTMPKLSTLLLGAGLTLAGLSLVGTTAEAKVFHSQQGAMKLAFPNLGL